MGKNVSEEEAWVKWKMYKKNEEKSADKRKIQYIYIYIFVYID